MVEYAAYEIKWTEAERGYGQRPCGTSVYVSKDAAEKAITEHWKRYPDSYVPDTYIFPSDPKVVAVDEETYNKLKES